MQVGVLPAGHPSGAYFGCEQVSAAAHEVWLSNRVLSHKPSGFCAVFASNTFVRPAMLGEQFAEFTGVRSVHGFHAWVVAVKEGAVGCKFVADRQVSVLHQKQRFTKMREHGEEMYLRRLTFELTGPLRRALLARPGVHGTFSQPGPSRPTAAVRLALTLGLRNTHCVVSSRSTHSVPSP